MKLRVFLILVMVWMVLSGRTRVEAASWTTQTSNAPTTSAQLRAIWAADGNNAWSAAGGVNDAVLLKWNGSSWAQQSSTATRGLYSIWGTGTDNVWVGGRKGHLMRYNGTNWSTTTSNWETDGTNGPYFFYGLWGSAANSVWAVGSNGQYGPIVKWNGSSWSNQLQHSYGLRAVWGTSATDVWAVGESCSILHFNGTSWSTVSAVVDPPLAANTTFFSIWGADANNIWLGGGSSGTLITLLKWNGSSFSRFSTTGLPAYTSVGSIRGIAGTSANNIYIAGDISGFASRWNGSTWTTESTGINTSLNAIWCSADGASLWASGAASTIIKGTATAIVSAPTLSSVSPAVGAAGGGTSVTLTGTNFTGATAVTFGGTAATSFTVNSATSITAVAPAHAAGVVSVVVSNTGGSNAANTLFTYIAAPMLSGASPAAGPTAGGTSVTLTGTNFTNATAVTFGGTAATTFTVNSDTSITATAPARAAGAVSVVVSTAGGSNGANTLYTYVAAPTLSGASPAAGPTAGGTSVTLTGTNFTNATAVTFGGTAATTFTVNSDTSITATAPARAAGAVSVVVSTAGGSNAANTLYTYVAAPTVSGVSPVAGPTTGGTSVTLTGTNFTNATAVTFGGTAATTFTVNSATSITATAPARAAGAVSVVVSTVGGSNGANTLYTYVAAPTLSAASPSAGPTAGGTSVTLTGTNFNNATAVTFGGTAATTFTVNSATSITAVAPARAAGAVSVVVTTAGGSNGANTVYTYVAAPTVSGASPAAGPTAGGTSVTLTGTNFTNATAVTFGGTAATTFTVNSATSITATTPAHVAGAVSVVVSTAGGSNGANTLYTYVAAPTLSVVSPVSGTTAGGTSVTLTGTNFTTATSVTFGGTAAPAFTVNNATTITATTPAHAAGTVSVVVNATGGSNAANTFYTYQTPAPEIEVFKGAGTEEINAMADNTGEDFIGVNAGASGGLRTFTIKNSGTANLTGIAVSSTNSAEFTVGSAGTSSSLTPDGTTSFTVTFSPAAKGIRSGVINISSNDADENPFNFSVQGTGLNNAPTDITLSNAALAENNSANATVGTLSATDADAGDTHSFSLVSGPGSQDNGSFTITGSTLKLTPSADFETKPSYNLRVQADDGADGEFAKAFTVSITNVNDAPTLAAITNPSTILEDAAEQTVNLSGISAGAGESQTLSVSAQSGNTSLIPHPTVTYTSPGGTGTLRYQPVANASGQAVITVTVSDGQSQNATAVRTFTVNVQAVNDPPAFTKGADQNILLPGTTGGGGPRSVTGWATGINDGDAEAVQGLSFQVTVTGGAALFSTAPALSSAGVLSYELSGQGGTAIVSVTLTDDSSIGGSAALTTGAQTFVISANHAPVTAPDTVGATQGATASINPRKLTLNDSDPDSDTISITAVQAGSANGSVSLTGGKILYTAASGFTGTDSFTYTLTDSKGASATGTVNVTVASNADPSQNYVVQVSAEGVRLRFAASPGASYLIQYSADLTNWLPLTGPVAADTHGVIEFLDTAGAPTRFYRLVAVP